MITLTGNRLALWDKGVPSFVIAGMSDAEVAAELGAYAPAATEVVELQGGDFEEFMPKQAVEAAPVEVAEVVAAPVAAPLGEDYLLEAWVSARVASMQAQRAVSVAPTQANWAAAKVATQAETAALEAVKAALNGMTKATAPVVAPTPHAAWVAARAAMNVAHRAASADPTAANWEAAKAATHAESVAYAALQATLAIPFKPCIYIPKVVKTKEQAFKEWGQRLNKSLRASNRRKASRA